VEAEMAIDPVSQVTAAQEARYVMGETQVRISTEAARKLSQLAEANDMTRTQMVEALINGARIK
jgi:hypothetical protein